MMSCRTGPLRAVRPLRGVYIPSGDAPADREEDCADQREDRAKL